MKKARGTADRERTRAADAMTVRERNGRHGSNPPSEPAGPADAARQRMAALEQRVASLPPDQRESLVDATQALRLALERLPGIGESPSDEKPFEDVSPHSDSIVRELREAVPDVMFRVRRDGTYFDYAPAMGLGPYGSPERFLGRRIDEILPLEVARPAMRDVERAIETRQMQSAEYDLTVDGTVRSYEARTVAAGADHVVRFVREITERKSLENERAALLERTARESQHLQALVDMSPVGIMAIEGPDQQIVLINREMERLLGFGIPDQASVDEVVRPRLSFRRPDLTLLQFDELPLQRALVYGETTRAEEMLFEFPDGRLIPVLVNATPILSSTGEVMSAIAAVQDMTSLEEVERLRNEFLGMVTHELRTPLTTIKGAAATMLSSRRPLAPDEVRELFEIIDGQSDRLRDLVDSLLDMTRIEAGALSVTATPIDLRSAIDEASLSFARAGALHRVERNVPEALPAVSADKVRVVQVLTNLLGNADRFSPADSPITVSVASDAAAVTVRVIDHGRGIPQDKLSLLFQKFSQVHEDDRRGAGLGLAICRGIVEAHGGRIWAESNQSGGGTTISFTLPIAPHVADASTRVVHRAISGGNVRQRILVIDDDPQILRYLKRTLEDAGHHVIALSNPSEVTAHVQAEQVDLLLVDLTMPGTTGFELLQRVREFCAVPVIILTASNNCEDAVRALTLGADDYVTKPFAPSELLARIGAVLRRRTTVGVQDERQPYTADGLTIDFVERRVSVAGIGVDMSATEYKLLRELAVHAGQVLTHDQLLQRVWGDGYVGDTELLRSFVRNVRRKIGDDARQPRYILTERQVGYRMHKHAG